MARSSVSTPRSSNQDLRISHIRLSDKEAHASIARSLRVGRRLQILNVRGEVNRLAPLSLSFSAATGLLELGSLPSTGVTRLPRYYEPVRHLRRPGLSLAGVRWGFRSPPMGLPVLQQLPVCQHAVTITPVGPLGRIVRDEGLSTPRFSPATAAFPVEMAGRLPRSNFRGLLGVHYSFRPVNSPHRSTVRLSRRLRRLRYLHRRSDSFRLERSNLAGWDLHPLGRCALSRRTFITIRDPGFAGRGR